MTSKTSENYILPPDSIKAVRYAVYFESEWLWKEKIQSVEQMRRVVWQN